MEKKLSRQERERLQLIETVTRNAEDLFKLNGYENTTLDALAENSEYTKRTIYRYFVSKEDLYFAVMLKGHTQWLEAIRAGALNGKSGYEKIRMAYKASLDFFNGNGWLFDLIAHMKSIESKKTPDELPYFEKYAYCLELIHKEITDMFVLAHEEKSIRTDIGPRELGVSSAFVLNGLFHMLRLYDDFFTRQHYLDKEQFIDFTAKFLYQALEPELR